MSLSVYKLAGSSPLPMKLAPVQRNGCPVQAREILNGEDRRGFVQASYVDTAGLACWSGAQRVKALGRVAGLRCGRFRPGVVWSRRLSIRMRERHHLLGRGIRR